MIKIILTIGDLNDDALAVTVELDPSEKATAQRENSKQVWMAANKFLHAIHTMAGILSEPAQKRSDSFIYSNPTSTQIHKLNQLMEDANR